MTCDRVTIPPPPAPRRQSRSDYNMQGLIGLPFVPAMPFINGRRTSAARNGRETLAALKLGESLSGGADGFAHGHSGVRVLRGDAPDYQVMTIDLGSVANNNLDNSDDVALVGVRAGRVEWIAPSVERGQGVPALFGSNVLCLDRGSVAGKARPGCNTYGRYAP